MVFALPPDVALVIFDCDGVLVDSEVLCCSELAKQMSAIGLVLSTDEVMTHFLGRGFEAIEEFAHAATGVPLPPSFRADLAARVTVAFAGLRAIPGAVGAVTRAEVPVCVGSSSNRDRVLDALGRTGFLPLFEDRIWTLDDVRRGKPAPDIFLKAASAMQIAPEHALVIEDSINGVLAARAAGMRAWGFVGGSHCHRHLPRLLEAGAERVFDRMDEFWPRHQ